jgi:hypothetical protein
VAQICKAKGWDTRKRLRLVAAGRELFEQDTVTAAHVPVLHCIILQDEHPAAEQSRRSSHRQASPQQQPAFDWVRLCRRCRVDCSLLCMQPS